jgi:hypothetical protein
VTDEAVAGAQGVGAAGGAAGVGAAGVALTEAEVRATGESIARAQEPSGAIAWPDGHVDVWDHVECAMALSACGMRGPARRAYAWLRATQRADGSWPRASVGGVVTDPAAESHHAAYVAAGAWHEYLVTGDESHARAMWPTVRRAIGWALALRGRHGEIAWERDAAGRPGTYALLSGCASIHQSLRCAVALGKLADDPQPDWEVAADRLAHLVASAPGVFADKSRFAMDWYYPVLGGPLRGAAGSERLARGWDTFVAPGLGVRCVSDQPWVTGAETCELAIALDVLGDQARALDLMEQIQHLRDPGGGYWTGWQFVNQAHFPNEQSSWTSAAVVLAADALSGATGGAAIFADIPAPKLTAALGDGASCGCGSADPLPGPLKHS